MSINEENLIKKFIKLIKEYRVDQAVVQTIPIIGTGLDTIFYKNDLQDILQKIEQESEKTRSVIIARINVLSSKDYQKSEAVLVVGSGNAEEISICIEPVVTGAKHKVKKEHKYGGSALNYSMRLLCTGHDVYPVLTIGRDRIGREIKDKLIIKAENSVSSIGTIQFINSDNFLHTSIKTPSSTVIASKNERTIFSQEPKDAHGFELHLENRIQDMLRCYPLYPSAVMIGHMYPDAPVRGKSDFAPSTVLMLNKFKDHSLIYTNFGSSQIKHGIKKWEKHLHCIDIFQLNINEAKKLFEKDKSVNTLTDILLWFQNKELSVVITLDKFGAVAIHKHKKGYVIIALPIIGRDKVVDTTGAGDAFAVGMVAKLKGKKNFSVDEYDSAIGQARLWAAECCTHYGASSECPSLQTLERFGKSLSNISMPETLPLQRAYDTLTLIDLAYS